MAQDPQGAGGAGGKAVGRGSTRREQKLQEDPGCRRRRASHEGRAEEYTKL